MTLEAAERIELLRLARASIAAGLEHGELISPPRTSWDGALLQHRSSFVTLRIAEELRGCCGTLEAARPLAEDVWRNAWASAFCDPRFAPLRAGEWPHCELHISVLTAPMPLAIDSEEQLLAQLRPGVDGLILQLGVARATFLPAVWDTIGDPAMFVRQLKLKAGWHAHFWSPQIQVWRYESESFGEE